MSNVTSLASLSVASLVALHNSALDDFGTPAGMAPLSNVKRKATAIEAIEALCAAGSLAVAFNGDTATIVDASAPEGGDEASNPSNGWEAPEGDEGGDEGGDADEGDEDGDVPAFGDGKGKVRAWGFKLGSDEWLAANPRGTAAREAYRKARRAAARNARKAKRAALEAAAE